MKTLFSLLTLAYLISLLAGISMSLETHLAGWFVILAGLAAHAPKERGEEERNEGSGGLLSLAAFAISAVLTYLILPGKDQ